MSPTFSQQCNLPLKIEILSIKPSPPFVGEEVQSYQCVGVRKWDYITHLSHPSPDDALTVPCFEYDGVAFTFSL